MAEISTTSVSCAQMQTYMPQEYQQWLASLRNSSNSVAVDGSEGLLAKPAGTYGEAREKWSTLTGVVGASCKAQERMADAVEFASEGSGYKVTSGGDIFQPANAIGVPTPGTEERFTSEER